ncbi:N-acetylglucosamine-6-phosphate deacetylase [Nakamurella endophytica]|uniref:N-acetylglucosamine-6-phosphate deacetylase n=1 Tax=Nakamurella endophytica TaxID=1748367 RepID=A0A917SYX3_9ACTN|nr:N-acetylglucosamine-6-phosphate deacetylase [Nakamurella endophytica]GGM02838.1 N-acetylglucosamine-6-phosphate deacetylase [Nakamurella endophytica]
MSGPLDGGGDAAGELVVAAARVVTPAAVLAPGWLRLSGGTIAAVGEGAPPSGDAADPVPRLDLPDSTVLPGLVDLHVHGGGGATFDEGAASVRAGLAVHRAAGTTRSLVSLVTAQPDTMVAAVRAAAGHAATDPTVLGLHLEGPFLDVTRRGVHDPAALRDPDPELLDRLLEAGDGRVAVVTVAPERPGGLDLVRRLVAAGVHAAVGHTDATYDQAAAAFAAGADLVTHAWNGMRPLHHRDPALVGAAMDAPGVVLEVINDGIHVHPAAVRLLRAAAPGRVALVTDAMAAAGLPGGDGRYRLGSFDVTVTGGVARLTEGGSIAGSTLTLDEAVRRAVRDVGVPLVEAVAAASTVPAGVLGVADRFGALAPGHVADLVVTDAALQVRAVMVAGRWWDDRRP